MLAEIYIGYLALRMLCPVVLVVMAGWGAPHAQKVKLVKTYLLLSQNTVSSRRRP
jgi:hypothetical protein